MEEDAMAVSHSGDSAVTKLEQVNTKLREKNTQLAERVSSQKHKLHNQV